jgi:hypothetical protein
MKKVTSQSPLFFMAVLGCGRETSQSFQLLKKNFQLSIFQEITLLKKPINQCRHRTHACTSQQTTATITCGSDAWTGAHPTRQERLTLPGAEKENLIKPELHNEINIS